MVVLGVLLLSAGGVAALVGCGGGSSGGGGSPRAAGSYVEPGTYKKGPASLGESLTLTDQGRARVRFTVESAGTERPAKDELLHPATRKQRIYAVRVRMTAPGPKVYDDLIANALSIVVEGTRHRPLSEQTPACRWVPLDPKGRPGATRSGCYLFKLPRSPEPTRIRFWPSSENAPDLAYWRLP